ncbi:hypothetical protein DIS24_g1031 [Lasiodiplodia hormozganensis]|uniref:Rhodopsin domain-containing protein n=2 Tax=Lasiodiplodia hormozganensis TaxID=869390 RepID=A0AA39Z4Q9_9PEZI|nr:hypothetical protein DIS24_g1031 [Lasiodiplodia hormozganensis]
MSTLADYIGPELAGALPPANHVNPDTDVGTVLGTEISLTILMVIFVCMRFYSRLFINGLFGTDDAVMGLAAITAIGHTIVTCLGTRHGIGYHIWDVDPEKIPTGFKYTFTSILLFHPISALTKISVCCGYLRLFPGTGNLYFCWIMIAYSAMWGIASFFSVLFMCTPINLFWNQPFNIQRDCVDVLTLLVATAALNSLGDLLVYLWPIKFLFKLQMPLKHRLGLILLFSFGCIVFAASVCRIVTLPPAVESVDVLYNSSTLLLIASIEENIGIICGCLPCTKGTLAHFWPRIFGSSDRSSHLHSHTATTTTTPNFVHTGAGRITGYGDHSHNHSVKVVSASAGRCSSSRKGRKGSMMDEFELETGLGGGGFGDESRLMDEEVGFPGIVMTKEVTVKRSASMGNEEGGMRRVARDLDAVSSIGEEVSIMGDAESVGKGSRRSL